MANREQKRWQHHREEKQMRHLRKQIKSNREDKHVRRKDWMPDNLDNLDALYDLDNPASERVMPRGERQRRQEALDAAMKALREAEREEQEASTAKSEGQRGLVVEVSSGLCRVELGERVLLCGVRGTLSAEETGFTNVVAVGDEVMVSEDGLGGGIVQAVLPRRSALARPDAFSNGGRVRDRHLEQVIVANADQLLIVASWRNPPLWPELVDRYLISAERNHLACVICVNKIDLAQDVADCHAALKPYTDLGYRVLLASALTDQGIDELRQILHERTTVLAGMSGVGKSSLLAAAQPGFQLRTAAVSERSGEGRHTTTQVNLLRLPMGGAVVDTPGIRGFGLGGLSRRELIRFYPEIAAAGRQCRFSNCLHASEPGCAVRAAAEHGALPATRYHSYCRIRDELAS